MPLLGTGSQAVNCKTNIESCAEYQTHQLGASLAMMYDIKEFHVPVVGGSDEKFLFTDPWTMQSLSEVLRNKYGSGGLQRRSGHQILLSDKPVTSEEVADIFFCPSVCYTQTTCCTPANCLMKWFQQCLSKVHSWCPQEHGHEKMK